MDLPEKTKSIWNYASSIGIAFTIPYIIYKVLRTIYLNKVYGSLAGKVVVITGASSGLGEALAHEFYRHGCQVVLCARRRKELDRVRQDLLNLQSSGPVLHPIIEPIDLADLTSLQQHAKNILSITGHVDILINNGGLSNRGSVLDTLLDVDLNIMNVNYFGHICFTKAFLPSMIKREQGHIINVSSVQGLIAIPNRSSYSASKHALQAFSDCLRAEVSKYNIKVTVVSPGYIKTNLSLNALTAEGTKHMAMDKNTENGYEAAYVAQKIFTAVTLQRSELVIAPLYIRLAVFVRKYLPNLYFVVMNRRAQKQEA